MDAEVAKTLMSLSAPSAATPTPWPPRFQNEENDQFALNRLPISSSVAIARPRKRSLHVVTSPVSASALHRWSVSRLRQNGPKDHDYSPTGIEDDGVWFDSDHDQHNQQHNHHHHRRDRLASVCSSDAGSDYGGTGLGRTHLEVFNRMEISAADQATRPARHTRDAADDDDMAKCIGSYSPEARKKRIERFLEKRKRRVWAKKVDYDVRKNFANSRLRVKGRFVKKEDEELLCLMLSFT